MVGHELYIILFCVLFGTDIPMLASRNRDA